MAREPRRFLETHEAYGWRVAQDLGQSALADIAAERARQMGAEGWSHQHDDQYQDFELAKAAACYAVGVRLRLSTGFVGPRGAPIANDLWPWDRDWWKPKTPRENLVRAAALLVAEIERIDRAQVGEGV